MLGKLKAYATAHVDEKARRDVDTAAANITDRIRVRSIVVPAIGARLARNEPSPCRRRATPPR